MRTWPFPLGITASCALSYILTGALQFMAREEVWAGVVGQGDDRAAF